MDSITINPKDFDSDTISPQKSTMDRLSRGKYIWSSVVNNELVQLQKYCAEFILPLKHYTQRTEAGVQYIAT